LDIAGWLRQEIRGLWDLLFPSSCPSCGVPLATGPARFCPLCRDGILPLQSPRCPSCWLPYPTDEGTDHPCEACLRDPPLFSAIRAAGIYGGTLQKAIQQFKFERAIHFDAPLAGLLAEVLESRPLSSLPDLIVPVPLHPCRLRQREYNQSHLLAKRLAQLIQVPMASRQLLRTKPTPPQQTLPAKERRKNLRRAFAMAKPLSGEKILLVDDVLTTGATARECSRTLLDGGAGDVTVAVLARAQRHLL